MSDRHHLHVCVVVVIPNSSLKILTTYYYENISFSNSVLQIISINPVNTQNEKNKLIRASTVPKKMRYGTVVPPSYKNRPPYRYGGQTPTFSWCPNTDSFPLIYWPVQHPFEGGLVHIELFLVFQNFVQKGTVLFIQIVVGQIVVGGEGLDVDILTGKLQTKSTLHYKSIQFTVIS